MRHSDSHHDAPGAVVLRSVQAGDEPFLRRVYASTREEELALTGWDASSRAQFVDLQFRAMRQGYLQTFPAAEWSIIALGAQAIGYVVVDRPRDEIRIVDMALLPDQRGHGVGGQLVRGLQVEAAGADKPLRVRVLKGARSAHLCERQGFRRIGEAGFHEHWEWRAPG